MVGTAKSEARKERYYKWMPWLTCFTLGAMLLSIFLTHSRRARIRAIVEVNKWKTPVCAMQALRARDLALPSGQRILDSNSICSITLENTGGPEAFGTWVRVPSGKWVEVTRPGCDPNVFWTEDGYVSVGGGIKEGLPVMVEVWSMGAPSKKSAKGITAGHAEGLVKPRVIMPLPFLAEIARRHPLLDWILHIGSLLAIGGLLTLWGLYGNLRVETEQRADTHPSGTG